MSIYFALLMLPYIFHVGNVSSLFFIGHYLMCHNFIIVLILLLNSSKKESSAKEDAKKDQKNAEACAKSAGKQPEKDDKKEIIRSVWISGLSSVTRAVDLKTTFSNYGKVSSCME